MADLVQRLRDWERIYPEDQDEPDHCLYLKAANRIEELEADNKGLRHMILDQINSTGDDPEIMAATRAEWAARAKDAEAKLAKAAKFIGLLDKEYQPVFGETARQEIRELYAELTGDSDD